MALYDRFKDKILTNVLHDLNNVLRCGNHSIGGTIDWAIGLLKNNAYTIIPCILYIIIDIIGHIYKKYTRHFKMSFFL